MNIGEVNISERYIYIDIYQDGDQVVNTYTYSSLAVNESTFITGTWTLSAGNKTNISAKIDPYDYISESNETNNDLEKSFPLRVFAPDLIVTDITWSPNVTSASFETYITFNATIKNIGEANISTRDQYVYFYVDGSYVGYGYLYSALAVNESISITRSWYVTGGNKTKIRASVDPYNEISENNETNNELEKNFSLRILTPDLIITNITWTPDVTEAKTNDILTFNATVKNVGEVNLSSRSIYVYFYVDGIAVGSESKYISLNINDSTFITKTWSVTANNKTYVRAEVDPYYYIPETNESNNDLRNNFSLRVFAPDLVVSYISFSPIKIGNGDAVIFTANLINAGETQLTNDFYVRYNVDGNTIEDQYITIDIPANGSIMVTSPVSWTAVPGSHVVQIRGDSYDYVSEINETNNELSLNFNVQEKSRINNITLLPEYPGLNTDINVSANVTDDFGVKNVTLFYSYDGIIYQNITMENSGVFSALIPGRNFTTTVQYYIMAYDSDDLASNSSISTFIIDGELPTFGNASIKPEFPNITSPVKVFVYLKDNVGIANATLFFRFNNQELNNISLNTSATGSIDVLILGADDSTYVIDVRDKILRSDFIRSADIFDVRSGTPTLKQLEKYDSIITWSNYCYSDPVGIGNVLANYLENGGGVVVAVFSYNSGCFQIQGRFLTDNFYTIPAGSGSTGGASTINSLQPDHPILTGFNSITTGSYRANSFSIVPGSDRIVDWGDGAVLAATRDIGNGRTVGIGFFPPSSDIISSSWSSSTDGDILMANSLLFAAKRELSAVIPSANTTTNVTFFINVTDLSGNSNTSQIYSYYADGSSPLIENVTNYPLNPTISDPVNISADIIDDQNVKNVSVNYSLGNGWKIKPMISVGGNKYQTILDISQTITNLTFYIIAQDVANNMNSSELFTVDVSSPRISVSPYTWDFGNIEVKTNNSVNFTIRNTGDFNLSVKFTQSNLDFIGKVNPITDIDKDGIPEVIVRHYSWGNTYVVDGKSLDSW